jgi:hypothetical protein
MVCRAIVTVPGRGLVPVFARYVAVTDPAAVPLTGDTLIQVESLTVAVHDPPVQPLGPAVTVNVVEPPLAGIAPTDVGVAENEQVGGKMPASVIVIL